MFEEKKFPSAAEKSKWAEILGILYMSSEEENTIVVHPLPWLAEEVNIFKKGLGDSRYAVLTAQAGRQMNTRINGDISTRDKPNDSRVNAWILLIE